MGFSFRSQNYTIVKVRLTKDGNNNDIYLDTNYGVTLIDYLQLEKLLPSATTRLVKIALPLKVRGVGLAQYETSKYLITPYYFLGTNAKGNNILIYIRREIYIIDSLRANILISNNFIRPEEISIYIIKQRAYIGSYKISVNIIVR